MADIKSKIPDELLILSEAYNSAILNSNRAWFAAATLTIIAIGASAGKGNGPIPGVELSGYNFFAALALALTAINLRLCSVHSNLYEAQWILHRYLSDIGASSTFVSQSVTIKDVAHRMSASAYNRIYPILFSVREESREKIMNFVKPPFESLYLGTPLLGMIVALKRCFSTSQNEELSVGDSLLISFALILVVIQFFISITTLIHVLGARKRLSDEHGLK